MSQALHQERLMTVIQGPHLSEKAHIASEGGQVVFKVRTDANKAEIKKAVELLFDVSVDSVTTVNCRGKQKRHGIHHGRRVNWKKAYVTLAEGSEIELLGGE